MLIYLSTKSFNISTSCFLGTGFEWNSKSALRDRETLNAFRQGKTLTCKDYDSVNKKNFIYVSGTQTFIPKDGVETLEGLIVRISTCSVEK